MEVLSINIFVVVIYEDMCRCAVASYGAKVFSDESYNGESKSSGFRYISPRIAHSFNHLKSKPKILRNSQIVSFSSLLIGQEGRKESSTKERAACSLPILITSDKRNGDKFSQITSQELLPLKKRKVYNN